VGSLPGSENARPLRPIVLSAIAVMLPASAGSQPATASWLDSSSFESWNSPGMSVPFAPQGQGNPDPRCRELARLAEADEDRQLRAHGWDLVGPSSAAEQIRVIAGAADYDGMCRPRQYQYFVFRRGIFAGTLSPNLMDSRTDGALGRVTIQSDRNLKAEYARYAAADPLCCPSRRTTVLFSIEKDPPTLRPLSATTVSSLSPSAP
jgi:LppP/LprE lipoprotein